MLQYRRRNSDTLAPTVKLTRHPLLTYVNWSYERSRQLDNKVVRKILSQYDENYNHVYLRLINEVPKRTIDSFLEQEKIESTSLLQIYQQLKSRGFDIKSF